MERDEQIAVIRETAETLVDCSPAAASVLYGLCGAMETEQEELYALHCLTLIRWLRREVRAQIDRAQARLN